MRFPLGNALTPSLVTMEEHVRRLVLEATRAIALWDLMAIPVIRNSGVVPTLCLATMVASVRRMLLAPTTAVARMAIRATHAIFLVPEAVPPLDLL